LDSEKVVCDKFKKAFCPAGEVEDNGVLSFIKHVLFVLKEDKGEEFVVERDKKFGGNISYKNYKILERDFVDKKLHPLDLKKAVAREVNKLLDVVRKGFGDRKLVKEAYP